MVWQKPIIPVCLRPQSGDVTEWLGRGLQNLLRRFESARHLFSCFPCVTPVD